MKFEAELERPRGKEQDIVDEFIIDLNTCWKSCLRKQHLGNEKYGC
jgi:hypothetical protein